MMKKFFAVILAVLMLLAFAGCTDSGNTDSPTAGNTDHIREVKTKVAVAEMPMALGLEKLKTDRAYAYEVTTAENAAELIKSGSADIAALPLDAAAKLFNETNGGVKLLSVINTGYLYIVTNYSNLTSVDMLKNQTVYAVGKGTMNEQLINFVLSENGVDPEKDVDIQYSDDADALVKQAINDKKGIYILPEPYATQIVAGTVVETETTTAAAATQAAETDETTEYKPTSTTSIFGKTVSFAKEYKKLTDSALTYGCIVARTDYINANPDIISEFMTFSEVSVNYVGGNIEQATIELTDSGYFTNNTAAYNSIISSNITFIEADELEAGVSKTLEALYSADSAPIAGAIPDESFYY